MGSLETRKAAESHGNFPIYRSSKAALNMIMLHYAGMYGGKGWKVNSCVSFLFPYLMFPITSFPTSCLALYTPKKSGNEQTLQSEGER